MGYHMRQRATQFTIPKERQEAALAALKALHGQETCTTSQNTGGVITSARTHFAWVDSAFLTAPSLTAALRCWRWDAELSPFNGDIVGIVFLGEKLGDDELLFETIAPWVEPGSYIQMTGEDDAVWRWVFNGQTCKEIQGKIVFEEG